MKTSTSLIYPKKEHSTSVSEESDHILTPLKLSSRKEEEDNSCQEKQNKEQNKQKLGKCNGEIK